MFANTNELLTRCIFPILCTGLIAGCVPKIDPLALEIPARDQEIPAVLVVGPMDVGKVSYKGEPLNEDMEQSVQTTIVDSLKRTQVFKDVLLLDKPQQVGFNKVDTEKLLNTARSQHADLLLVGEVQQFETDVPVFMFGSQYDVKMRLLTQLINVHTGGQVWKKTEQVKVVRKGSGVRRMGSLDTIVRNVTLPSAIAGVLPSLVERVQSDRLMVVKNSGSIEQSSIFGGAELAKIDADLAPPMRNVSAKEHAYAVIVGVEDYRDLPRVDYAIRDAEMMKQYLVKALGYREQNIVMLLNDRVTRSQLEARLEKWLPKQVAEHKDAEVFVYYGGHGAPDQNTNQSFLVPYDGDPSFLETTAYPLNRLYKVLGDLSAKQVVVVVDSCFSGSGGRSVIAKGARPMLISVTDPVIASSNLIVLSAAASNQISSAYMDKRHGLFTYYFLKGIQGEADANKDSIVDLQELDAYLKSMVPATARRMQVDQTPQLLPPLENLGPKARASFIDLKR
jgi:hypothetical protein